VFIRRWIEAAKTLCADVATLRQPALLDILEPR